MKVYEAKDIAGKVSEGNTKMPGSTYALSAKHCLAGSKLAQVEGSVCHRCYALKLQKLRPSVDKGWTNNYFKATKVISDNPSKWVEACTFQITRISKKTGECYHRWFDSGDLQSVEMLTAICSVATSTLQVKHWLPTREAKIVKDFLKSGGVIPNNLVVRVSSTMIDDAPIKGHANTSTVHRKNSAPHGHSCPASSEAHRALRTDNAANCGPCRACWDKSVPNVSYPLH